jgi:hypothetical protein
MATLDFGHFFERTTEYPQYLYRDTSGMSLLG